MLIQEEAIRSTFGALVAQTARLWRREVDRELQPFGLTEATWLPLLRLARAAEPMRQKDLAASLSLDGSSVVRLIDALEAAGLVERHESEEDRRAKAIVLTKAGQRTVEQVEAVSAEVRNRLLADIPQADLEAAARTLERINRTLSKAEEGVA